MLAAGTGETPVLPDVADGLLVGQTGKMPVLRWVGSGDRRDACPTGFNGWVVAEEKNLMSECFAPTPGLTLMSIVNY